MPQKPIVAQDTEFKSYLHQKQAWCCYGHYKPTYILITNYYSCRVLEKNPSIMHHLKNAELPLRSLWVEPLLVLFLVTVKIGHFLTTSQARKGKLFPIFNNHFSKTPEVTIEVIIYSLQLLFSTIETVTEKKKLFYIITKQRDELCYTFLDS